MAKPVALFYCQHSLGIGHLTRSFALSQALAESFEVVFLNGGPLPPGIPVPPGVTLVDLPPLGMDDGHTVVSRAGHVDVDAARATRRRMLVEAVARHRPHLVLVELFPFGRKKFAGEILPLIRAARALPAPARIVCSVRDILVDARPDQQRHDDRARWLAQRYFDAVLVHTDPALARLEDSFRPRRPLTLPVIATGYVVPRRATLPACASGDHVLVSAGGGKVGGPLFTAALAAQARLWPGHRIPMRIIAGPFLPEREWEALLAQASGQPGITLVRHVPDMVAEMRGACLSISQCGYNTALDVLVAGTPAIMVPYAPPGENEQRRRADTLWRLGAIHSAPADTPALGEVLVDQIPAALAFRPRATALNLDGARISHDWLAELCALAPSRSLLHA